MDSDDLKALQDDLFKLSLTRSETEHLIKFAAVLPPGFGRARLLGLGRDKLVLVLPLLTKDNALALLRLAEQHPVDQFAEIVEAQEAKGVLPNLRLSPYALRRIGDALEATGVVEEAEKVGTDEALLLRQIEELAAMAEGARTILVNAEKSSKVTRLVLRIESERRWALVDKLQLAEIVEALLKSRVGALNSKLAEHKNLKVRVGTIKVFFRGPDMPAYARRARQMGFDRADNPHPPGSRQHRAWNKEFQHPDLPIFGVRN